MDLQNAQYEAMWHQVFDLCQLARHERIIVLTGQNTHPVNLNVATAVLHARNLDFFRIDLPPTALAGPAGGGRETSLGVTPLTGKTIAVSSLKACDFVLDLMGLLHSPEQLDILQAKTRMLMVVEPPEILARMLPTPEDKQRVLAADQLLKASSRMHLTSPAGTDLSVAIGDFPTLPEYGYTDEPGHWDHWPSGFISTWPNEGTAEGRVVIAAGDMMFPFKTYVRSPVTLEIEAGYIQKITGDFDALYLRRYLESYNDPEAYAVSHLGWGLQKKAQWAALGMRDKNQSLGMDGRAAWGNFLFSTGPNAEAGGSNASRCHIDIPMFGCTLYVDDEWVLDQGRVVMAEPS